MTEIINPHDKFFKEMFSQIEVAQDFCRNYLPQKIVALLDLSTLIQCKDTFVDHELSEQYSDLLLSVQTISGVELYLYLLFEHKSYPDPQIGWQFLSYMMKIWENDRKIALTSLMKPILPLLVYHGEKGWTVSLQFQDLFPYIPELEEYLPRFRYMLYDLSKYSDEEIVGTISLQVTLLLLKYIFQGELEQKIWDIFRLLGELNKQRNIHELLVTVIKYIMASTDRISPEKIETIRKETIENSGDMIMPSIAERWVEQGLAKGREEGREEGLQESIIEILNFRFGEISDSLIQKLSLKNDLNQLRNLRKLALTTSSLESFEQTLE